MSPSRSPDRDLARRVVAEIRAERLLRPDARVLVAVSGGMDSMVLLHLLRFGGEALGVELAAAHFDHATRPESGGDAEWVRGVCRAWGIPLHEGRADVPPRSEAEARRARYAFLRGVADATGADHVLTAHHADDQAETVLFRAIRGSGPGGLGGVRRVRGRLVRPLLHFTRAELAAHAAAHRLRWRTDATNRDERFARNRLRHDVLPRLEAVRRGAARALARLAERAAASERAWRRHVRRLADAAVVTADEDAIELALPRLQAYDPEERARVLRHLLRRFGCLPNRAGTRAALQFIGSAASGRVLHLPGGVRLEREYERIRIRREAGAAPLDQPLVIEAPGAGIGVAVIGGRRLRVRWWIDAATNGDQPALELQTADFPLSVRSWRPGDRVRLPGGSRKVKRLFADRRVGRSERARRALLADAAGRILWIEGLERAADAAPAPGAQALHLELDEAGAEHGG